MSGTQARHIPFAATLGDGTPVKVPGFPVKLSRTPPALRRAPPHLGEHTSEVLREIGLVEDDEVKAALVG